MADEISIEGKEYISSRRASELSAYTQDYIGQLARNGFIEARRVGGLWYILSDSLKEYKSKAETFKPIAPQSTHNTSDRDSVISFDGHQYVSAARAAKSTGYHQDYIGQLARLGKVISRQIGNRWYVDHEALLAHKREKDALLGAVQAQSVGVSPSRSDNIASLFRNEAFFTYTSERADLIPQLGDGDIAELLITPLEQAKDISHDNGTPIQIRRMGDYKASGGTITARRSIKVLVAVLVVIITVATVGSILSKNRWINTKGAVPTSNVGELASTDGVAVIVGNLAEWIESILGHEMTYQYSK